MKKILVQIDGSNFYHKVKRIASNIHLTTFDYKAFALSLIKTKSILSIIYYIGEIKNVRNDKKNQLLFANQQKLFFNLREQGIDIKLGYLLKSGGVYHEKGVDVQIAVDMVRGAIKNEYDACFLISSDTDLLPAIETAKAEKKKIIYVGFENFISRALVKNCSSSLILKKKQLLKFT
jgi:uncharacterized protein (TIGR00288 family)